MAFGTSAQHLAALGEAVAALASGGLDDVPDGDLPDVAATLAGARARLDAAIVEVTGRLVESGAAERRGWSSAKDFLTHVTGGLKGAGGGLVRASEQLRGLPAVTAALKDGEVSLAQARTIAAKVATLPRDETFRARAAEEMLTLVRRHGHDATDLGVAFADVVRILDPDGRILGTDRRRERQERGAHHARFLSLTPDSLGGVRLRGYGTPEDAEIIRSVLMPLSAPVSTEPGACGGEPRTDPDEPVFTATGHRTRRSCPTPGCAHDGRDPRDHGSRFWDALVEACQRLIASDTLPRDHGSTPRVVVTIGIESLRDGGAEAPDGLLGGGQRISASAVRRLACDAGIIPAVLGSDGEVLDVGRQQRLVTPAMWTALVVRDRHCTFPGCTRLPLACDAHHVVHWADGGATRLDNLVLLCRHHHSVVHHTPWTLAIDPASRLPVWEPPPSTTWHGKISYRPATRPPGRLIA